MNVFVYGLFIACLPFLLIAVPVQDPGIGIRIPLSLRGRLLDDDGYVLPHRVNSHVARTVQKHLGRSAEYLPEAHSISLASRSSVPANGSLEFVTKRARTGTVMLTSTDDITWTAEIAINRQKFRVDLDTGSSDFSVPGPNCKGCGNRRIFDPKGSIRLAKNFLIDFTDGSSLTGKAYYDTVTFGGFSIEKQIFGVIEEMKGHFSAEVEGILGLGFPALSEIGLPTLFENLVIQHKLQRILAFRFSTYSQDQIGCHSELSVGAINDKLHTGSITWSPVAAAAYWKIKMDGVHVNGKNVVSETEILIDTASHLVIGDEKSIENLHKAFPSARKAPVNEYGPGRYLFLCDKLPAVHLVFGGRLFASHSVGFMVDQDSELCLSVFMAAPPSLNLSPTFWIIGTAFLSSVYTIFKRDVKGQHWEIGFAELASPETCL